jgi:hypothetical protein
MVDLTGVVPAKASAKREAGVPGDQIFARNHAR